MTFKPVLMGALALSLVTGAVLFRVSAGASEPQASKLPSVEVYKTPTCGCCSKWVDHMREAGFTVNATDVSQEELDRFRDKQGVPGAVRSCHTALTAGYVVEGHIPATEVKRFLNERPKPAGLAVPGMPLGSPGMEVSGVKPHPYDVLTFDKQGNTKVFATIKP